MRRFALVSGLASLFSVLSFGATFAQTLLAPSATVAAAPSTGTPAPEPVARAQGGARVVRASSDLPRFGVGVKVGTLGIGVDVATALTERINVRGGFNLFSYSPTFSKDGTNYDATLTLRSIEAKLDLYVLGGFHVSPGVLLYDDNNLSAVASVVGGRSFTLGGVTYFSNIGSPITGTAAVTLNKVAPSLGVGFGNMLPRSNRHFSVSLDLGVIYQGSPKFALALSGMGCTINGSTGCLPVNLVPGVPANLIAEQNKINDDLKPFKYYPEIAVGFGWKF